MQPQMFPEPRSSPGRYLPPPILALWLVLFLLGRGQFGLGAESPVVDLPPGVQAVWSIDKAYGETTPARERICLNGLWQWQPAYPNAKTIPPENWGYFKVPGCWPGITDYMQKDCQTVYVHPNWSGRKLAEVNAAWYQRDFTVPKEWAGRRVSVSLDDLNSYAAVYVDGRQAGEARFPGGEVDLTSALQDPGRHKLTLFVIALPLKGVMLSYTDSASAREQKGTVLRRGLCGDVFLVSTPSGARINDVRVQTSIRKKQLGISATLEKCAVGAEYKLRARVSDGPNMVKEFTSQTFGTADLRQGRIEFTQAWLPEKLWDIHTPQNQYQLELTLLDNTGKAADTSWTIRFGFRELWIAGRDFYLNGTRIFLSAVPLD